MLLMRGADAWKRRTPQSLLQHLSLEASSFSSTAVRSASTKASWCRKPTSLLVGCMFTSTCGPGMRRSCSHSKLSCEVVVKLSHNDSTVDRNLAVSVI